MLKPGSRRMPVPSVAGPLPVPAGGCAVVAPCGIFLVLQLYAVLIISTLQAKAKIQRNMAVLLGNRRDDAPKCNASRKQNPEYTNETATRLGAGRRQPDNLLSARSSFEQQTGQAQGVGGCQLHVNTDAQTCPRRRRASQTAFPCAPSRSVAHAERGCRSTRSRRRTMKIAILTPHPAAFVPAWATVGRGLPPTLLHSCSSR
jgi:hypothetical protein